MPIECNISRNGHFERQLPIEPGKFHTFRYRSEMTNLVILAACHDEDKGGLYSVMDEDEWDQIDIDGTISEEEIFEIGYNIIPPGGTVPLILRNEEREAIIISFSHLSPN